MCKNKKTIREHLETLPEPYRTQALDNMEPEEGNREVEGSADALISANSWGDTPEGFEYWDEFYMKLINGH